MNQQAALQGLVGSVGLRTGSWEPLLQELEY